MIEQHETPVDIILASSSHRRQELLHAAGVPFRVMSSEVDETARNLAPEELVVCLARRKADAVANRLSHDEGLKADRLIIGADTVVVKGTDILGKPADSKEAIQMLGRLSGGEHRVLTGLALVRQQQGAETRSSGVEETIVRFDTLTHDQIERYVVNSQPLDKAGAYGIQEGAAFFVQAIYGCYFNVVGLPLHRLYGLALSLGVTLR